jgi:hypothetical protein
MIQERLSIVQLVLCQNLYGWPTQLHTDCASHPDFIPVPL